MKLNIRIRLELEYGHVEECGCVGDIVAVYIGDETEPRARGCMTCMEAGQRERIQKRIDDMRN